MKSTIFTLLMILGVESAVFAKIMVPAHTVSQSAKRWVSYNIISNILTVRGNNSFEKTFPIPPSKGKFFLHNCSISPDGKYVAFLGAYAHKDCEFAEDIAVATINMDTCECNCIGRIGIAGYVGINGIRVQSSQEGPKLFFSDVRKQKYTLETTECKEPLMSRLEENDARLEQYNQCDWDINNMVDRDALEVEETQEIKENKTVRTTPSNSTENKSNSNFVQLAQKYRFWIAGGVIATVCATGLGYWLHTKYNGDNTNFDDVEETEE